MNSTGNRFVHFGDAEDILFTSFLREDEEAEKIPSEEERKAEEVKNRLQLALKSDDVSMFKHLLVEIPDLVEKYLDKPIPHLAAQNGALKVLQEFVSKPADSINSATSEYEATTPLYWAIRFGQNNVVNWLLSNGAFHQPLNVYQDSAVYVAVRYKQYDLLPVLKEHNCDSNISNLDGDLPIMCVVRDGNADGLEKLIACGADIYATDINKNTAMDLAIQLVGKEKIITKLVEGGYDVNTVNDKNKYVLRAAVKYHNTAAVKVLIPYTTCPEILEKSANLAISNANLSTLTCIMETKPNVDINLALRAERRHILKYLLNCNVRVDCKPVLYWSVYYCTMVTRSIASTSCQLSRLMYPREERLFEIHNAHEDMIQTLLEHGADVDSQYAETGSTALRQCAIGGLVCLTLSLLKAGCDPSIPDHSGTSALQVALQDCCNPFISLLKQKLLVSVAKILVEYIPYFSKEPSIPGLLQTASEKPSSMPLDLYHTLMFYTSSPRPLQHLCRHVLMKYLKPRPHTKVPKLGLPKRLQDYLLLEDLMEINREGARNFKFQKEMFCFFHRSVDPVLDKKPSCKGCPCDPSGVLFACKF